MDRIKRLVGTPLARVDGRAKVTGTATYAADVHPAGAVHGVVVQSAPARARIASIQSDTALAQPGVLGVYTHENVRRLAAATAFPMGAAWQSRPPLADDQVHHSGQTVAFVVAETFEAACCGAGLMRIEYTDAVEPQATLDCARPQRISQTGLLARLTSEDSSRGNVEQAFDAAPVQVDCWYETPRHLHMAMEPNATVAWWEDDTLTVREGTQWVDGAQDVFATWFSMDRKKVRLISPFVGGGFGLKVGLLAEAALPALVARELGRPVRMVLSRHQVCLASSGRPATRQRVRLAADLDGSIRGMTHDTINESDREGVFNEPGSRASKSAYAIEAYSAVHSVARLDIAPPAWMRAPGETPGSFATECALDELAIRIGVDPLELRLRNFAGLEPSAGKPWSSNRLRKAYAAGAAAFGWSSRQAEPRTRREGHRWIGTGMAMANYSTKHAPSEARLRLEASGTVVLESRGVDIGTGAYTAMTIVVAQVLDIPARQVEVRLGDTRFARSAFAGGSMMTASLGAAVHAAAVELAKKIVALATDEEGSPLHLVGRANLRLADGCVGAADGTGPKPTFAELLASAGRSELVAEHRTHPTLASRLLGSKAFTSMAAIAGPNSGSSAVHSFGAHFAEVAVDAELGEVQVRRMVGAFDCGQTINPSTARSQLLGGMVMGLGMALSEGVRVDARTARPVNANLGEYLVPVQADVPAMEVVFVGEFDPAGGPLGGKAVGELGITGAAAAIANAVFNACGRRVRSLPIDLRGADLDPGVG